MPPLPPLVSRLPRATPPPAPQLRFPDVSRPGFYIPPGACGYATSGPSCPPRKSPTHESAATSAWAVLLRHQSSCSCNPSVSPSDWHRGSPCDHLGGHGAPSVNNGLANARAHPATPRPDFVSPAASPALLPPPPPPWHVTYATGTRPTAPSATAAAPLATSNKTASSVRGCIPYTAPTSSQAARSVQTAYGPWHPTHTCRTPCPSPLGTTCYPGTDLWLKSLGLPPAPGYAPRCPGATSPVTS